MFGKIKNVKMQLNDVGKMIQYWWNQLPNKYPNVELDEFFVMPNHLHGIIVFKDHYCRGEVTSPLPKTKTNQKSNQKPTLGKIIAYYKYQTTN